MFSKNYISGLVSLLEKFPHEEFEKLVEAMLATLEAGRSIFTMGNGGSASTASHWVCDINKGCAGDTGKRFRMICLNDSVSTVMAYANDLSYEHVFSEQLKNFLRPGDMVCAISGSGNSPNVLRAVEYANANGAVTAGLCGYSGGKLARIAQIPLVVRVDDMQMVEDVHMVVVHMSMRRILEALGHKPGAC